jgi:16S rRNA (guanine(1405)-N(7))-methyltransferase
MQNDECKMKNGPKMNGKQEDANPQSEIRNPKSEIRNPKSKIENLVAAVSASLNYRAVSPELIARVGQQELARRRNLREAVKATKNKLHQVAGAYLESDLPYGAWLEELRAAGDPASLRRACRQVMSAHASTRERLPILDEFYEIIWAGRPPVRSVLDLACGLNPLTLPWMPLAENASYYAYDIYQDMVDFLGRFMALPLAHVRGEAQARDVLQLSSAPRVDLALLLKAIPCLEQMDKTAGARLLDMVQADYVLVSFPVRSLGRKEKGMVANYEAHFHELLKGRAGAIRRFEFSSELVFLISRD